MAKDKEKDKEGNEVEVKDMMKEAEFKRLLEESGITEEEYYRSIKEKIIFIENPEVRRKKLNSELKKLLKELYDRLDKETSFSLEDKLNIFRSYWEGLQEGIRTTLDYIGPYSFSYPDITVDIGWKIIGTYPKDKEKLWLSVGEILNKGEVEVKDMMGEVEFKRLLEESGRTEEEHYRSIKKIEEDDKKNKIIFIENPEVRRKKLISELKKLLKELYDRLDKETSFSLDDKLNIFRSYWEGLQEGIRTTLDYIGLQSFGFPDITVDIGFKVIDIHPKDKEKLWLSVGEILNK